MNFLLIKSILYRVIRILIVLIVSVLVTGSIGTALSISLIDAGIATAYYYYFDKYWHLFEGGIKHIMYKIKYRKYDK